jgi:hypothetical protein
VRVGITYWTSQLATLEAQGASVQTARSEIVGAFVQEFIGDVTLDIPSPEM